MITIFILDWSGTLDILDNTRGFLEGLREKYEGCKLVLNTGYLLSLPHEVRQMFDEEYFKSTEWNILQELIAEIDHYAIPPDTVSIADLERVVVVDDQLDMENGRYLQRRLHNQGDNFEHVKVLGFHSVEDMEKEL